VIDWIAPDDGGSEITDYLIVIRDKDMIYKTHLTNCDGSLAHVVMNTMCTIPITLLREEPFSLAWGDSLYAKVTAVNLYGSSSESLVGNGAVLLTIPDAPLNLANEPRVTSAYQIGLNWN
jgi:hypothetical protein